jgi:ribonuclease BN (tRNA processing enzyme)
VTAGDDRLLLDCGNGSLPNLQQRCDVADLDAVLLSHLHPDHIADIWGLYYARRFHPRGQHSIEVRGPAGTRELLVGVLGEDSGPAFDAVCHVGVAAAGDTFDVGALHVRLFAANHPVETLASRIEVGGRVIAFTADSGPSAELVACARAADLLIADATWLERDRPLPEGIHMTGREAGKVAADAGVARLLLTHILPTNDPVETAAEAAAAFDGEIFLATDLLELTL